jgi:hypothetical protein
MAHRTVVRVLNTVDNCRLQKNRNKSNLPKTDATANSMDQFDKTIKRFQRRLIPTIGKRS